MLKAQDEQWQKSSTEMRVRSGAVEIWKGLWDVNCSPGWAQPEPQTAGQE